MHILEEALHRLHMLAEVHLLKIPRTLGTSPTNLQIKEVEDHQLEAGEENHHRIGIPFSGSVGFDD